jgi:hypothetical protein
VAHDAQRPAALARGATTDPALDHLRLLLRLAAQRTDAPSAAIFDSRTL